MSEAPQSPGFFEGFENILKKYIIQILVLVVLYFLWRNGMLTDFIKEILALVGVFIFGKWAWRVWLHYIQNDFISGIDFVLLEIVPPREVLRSPKSMELFFTNALYHWSQKGGKEEYWQGAVWLWFSLEIASIDGQVHFYIRTPTRIRNLIETQMYAQYPQAQVKVVEDYTLAVDEISEKSSWGAWGCEFKLFKPEALPIKTYVDFGLDKDPKEEFKVDPIAPIIEFFGSLQKGEQAWLQILVTASQVKYKTEGTWFEEHDWVEESKVFLKKFLKPYTNIRENGSVEIRVPDFLSNSIKGVSGKITKVGFDTGIRVMYVAKKDVYDSNRRKDIRLIFRQYANPDSNQLWRYNHTAGDAIGASIFGLSKKQVTLLAHRMLREYQERGFFHHPLRHQLFNEHSFPWVIKLFIKNFFLPYVHSVTFVLNTEELASLWHFPGQTLKVPTLERIESKEAAPPTNLPI